MYYWRRLYRFRKSIGLICIGAGSLVLIIFVPTWFWFMILGALFIFLGFLLLKL